MFFTLERYAVRVGTRYLRRYFSKNTDVLTNEPQEFVLRADEDFKLLRREGHKSLKIAILGAPNVGKSTIVNRLARRLICPASSKVHTTQAKADAVYCEGDTQLIFMDTPGMVCEKDHKQYRLASSFKNDPQDCLKASDIVGIVQDAGNVHTRDRIDPNVLELLKLTKDIRNQISLILIFNKVDRVKKKELLLHLIRVITESKKSLNFSDVFMLSALTGNGIDDLRTYLLDSAKPRDWCYEEHVYSDHTCEDIIQQTVRAKLLDDLPNEVPYKLHVKLEHFDVGPDDSIAALVSVTCPTKRIMNLLLHARGNRIRDIAVRAEQELRNAFRTSVRLKIGVQTT
ncbi:hypothetical protein DMN91_001457 [Ooceraea biroi]|uniref:GTPase Era, mitochondrial n=1 Tax=Ooceraea biroi TaxID=2015173 RepID=A0A026WDK5_OOCBI|nr:GTPase Era, mitochondrial [Ooceraea biroi]EZA54170.1 GTPase Era, mitochondrial [Ooceraea biroi]RLU27653.1 hypothetical protein DMN91_001457 [Ooceraea biroi]